MNNDLKIIKKKYGEKMAHLCRDYFSTILETDGLLLKLMLEHFEPNHDLYEDIIKQRKENDFKDYIYSLIENENNKETKSIKTPEELLREVGYDLYECECEEDIQRFKKYYAKGEELCTFDGGRLDRCHVFFAVKKNVSHIRRKDFPNPERQDAYGTSVISIQFTRDESHTLSIKNRYNHTVNNPDSTFSNDLDNITPGLTSSFAEHYGLIQQHPNNKFELNSYVKASDGKYYKYNQEFYNVYYCPNNIIIDNFEVKRYDKEKYIVFDYFILDLVNKKIIIYDMRFKDTFIDTILNIERIEIKRKEEEKEIIITLPDNKVIIVLDKDNKMLKLENQNIKEIDNGFLFDSKFLQEINLPNVETIGDEFLYYNDCLRKINLPKLQRVGNKFLVCNSPLEVVDLPSLTFVGNDFLYHNTALKKLDLPSLRKVGSCFLFHNRILKEVNLPSLEEVNSNFLVLNNALKELSLPKLQKAGSFFIYENECLKVLNLPNIEEMGNNCLTINSSLEKLDLPKLQKVGYRFLLYNKSLKEISLPSIEEIGSCFLMHHPTFSEEDFISSINCQHLSFK